MPTYSYACKNCAHQFDIVQAFSDNALTDCPECGGTLRKVFNSVGVVFKGSGFYRTDNRGSSSSASTTSTTPAKSDGTSSSTAASTSAASTSSTSTSSASTSSPAKSAD